MCKINELVIITEILTRKLRYYDEKFDIRTSLIKRNINLYGLVLAEKYRKKICQSHRESFIFCWSKYSKESHLSLVKIYTLDNRFKSYF